MENFIFRAVKIINYTRNENLILSKNKNISTSRFQWTNLIFFRENNSW